MLRAERPIRTARLTLRPFGPGDLDDLYAYQSRPDVARYLHWDARDRAQAREALEQQCREIVLDRDGDWLTYAVVWRESGKVIGEVGLKWLSREHRQGEIGFVFNPDYQGRGLAAEAAEVLLRLGFDDLNLHRIIGSCTAQNAASARLMERLGMRQEAHFIHNEIIKGEWAEELVYAILDHEWRSRDRGRRDAGTGEQLGPEPQPEDDEPRYSDDSGEFAREEPQRLPLNGPSSVADDQTAASRS